jgi:hypothetical protein
MKLLPAALLLLTCAFAAAAQAERPWTLLFVDDYEILYRPATKRILHQPRRYEGNPVLTGPSLKNQVAYCSVYRDPTTGRYQMWYQMTGAGVIVCYAESADGITWTKPHLGLFDFKGIPDGNVVLTSHDHYDASVVVDPPGADPARRYKMAYWSIPAPEGVVNPKDPRGRNGGLYVAFSPDGIHWTKHPGPALRGNYAKITDPPFAGDPEPPGLLNSVSDVIDATYDPVHKKYVVFSKGWIDGPDGRTFWKRSVVRTESDDFLTWTPARFVMAPDEFDGKRPAAYPGTRQGVQLHSAPAFPRHGLFFGLIQLADFESNGQQPIELALSRDGGFTWSRPFRQEMFLPVGAPDTFESARLWSNATPVVLENEIRFYYGGAENPWDFGKNERVWGSKKKLPRTGIGFATLPLDRFAGVRPLEKIGQLTLKPRSLKGVKAMTLNADASAGAVRVELLDAAGYRLPGFTKADAIPLTGDQLRHRVAWQNGDLSQVPDQEITIRIHLDNAEVCALTLE